MMASYARSRRGLKAFSLEGPSICVMIIFRRATVMDPSVVASVFQPLVIRPNEESFTLIGKVDALFHQSIVSNLWVIDEDHGSSPQPQRENLPVLALQRL
ncbi:hypothetical protein R1flu_016104 [Riccia fluitans]|uniref:Uncharacterized protein n=1 Tax=Riccia fluitans TaxID=41844 RepID=A0ABD1YLD5_9MARC